MHCMGKLRDTLACLRPKHLIKNSFVLMGLLFSHQWAHWPFALAAFFAFSAMASTVYLLNDIADRQRDQLHPTKCLRPIACGKLSIQYVLVLACSLALVSLFCSYKVSVVLFDLILSYAVINILYSYRLKHFPIIDSLLVTSGFILRVLAGTIGIGIQPSGWLLICSGCLAFYLILAKRRSEAQQFHSHLTRRVLKYYTGSMWDIITPLIASCAVISYSLYTVSESTIKIQHTHLLVFTIPFVIAGIWRYEKLCKKGCGEDPVQLIYQDKLLTSTVSLWLITIILILLLA